MIFLSDAPEVVARWSARLRDNRGSDGYPRLLQQLTELTTSKRPANALLVKQQLQEMYLQVTLASSSVDRSVQVWKPQ